MPYHKSLNKKKPISWLERNDYWNGKCIVIYYSTQWAHIYF